MEEAIESRKEKVQHAEIGTEDARRTFADLIARVGFGGERIVITRFGKRIAAIVPTRDLEALDGAA